jgi:polyisoprenyl-teichoic acid--peptidoglycan teichoic acid transferase
MTNLPKQARIYVSLGVVMVIILVSFSIIFFGVYQVYFAPVTLFSQDFRDLGQLEDQFEDRVVNVAVLGLHNRNEDNTFGEIYFVDTIMIASINFDQDSLALLAVPRDSYVEITCSGSMNRLRQSYSFGYTMSEAGFEHESGLQCSIDTIDSLLDGVNLHYYIAMDIQGLKQLIDSMGGVYFNVEEPMIGFTPQESLDAGPQLLDGQGYMTYLTYREPDARDDLNRIKRQKELLLATFRYFQEMGLFSYVVPTYAAYREHIDTNLSFNQVAALALFAGERLESDAIRDYSLQGEYFTIDKGATYYLLLDEKQNNELLDQFTRESGGRDN